MTLYIDDVLQEYSNYINQRLTVFGNLIVIYNQIMYINSNKGNVIYIDGKNLQEKLIEQIPMLIGGEEIYDDLVDIEGYFYINKDIFFLTDISFINFYRDDDTLTLNCEK